MKRGAIFVGIMGLGLLAGAQQKDQTQQKKFSKPVKLDASLAASPVTEAEARETFTHVANSLKALTAKDAVVPPMLVPDSSKTVSRGEVIAELDAIYKMVKPYFKLNPNPVRYDATIITIPTSSPYRTPLENLIRGGFVDRVSNLATGKANTVDIADFGDAVGLFTARVADMTHMPSTRFSPNLEKDFAPHASGDPSH